MTKLIDDITSARIILKNWLEEQNLLNGFQGVKANIPYNKPLVAGVNTSQLDTLRSLLQEIHKEVDTVTLENLCTSLLDTIQQLLAANVGNREDVGFNVIRFDTIHDMLDTLVLIVNLVRNPHIDDSFRSIDIRKKTKKKIFISDKVLDTHNTCEVSIDE